LGSQIAQTTRHDIVKCGRTENGRRDGGRLVEAKARIKFIPRVHDSIGKNGSREHDNIFDHQLGESRMACGTMRWSGPTKRYGFIQPRAVARMYLSYLGIERAGLSTLNNGQRIKYELEGTEGSLSQ